MIVKVRRKMGFKVIYILGKIPFDSMLNVKIVPAFKTG